MACRTLGFILIWCCESSMRVYPENTEFGEKRIKKRVRHTPPLSPLNGGMNSTIPLLGGVPFYGGEGAFHFLMVTLK
jgi:hypothetical protein